MALQLHIGDLVSRLRRQGVEGSGVPDGRGIPSCPPTEQGSSQDSDFYMRLFQDMFNKEDKRRNDLDAQLSFPVAVITLLAGAALYCFRTAVGFPSSFCTIVLGVFSALSLVASALSALCVACVYNGQWKYACLPLASSIAGYKADLETWWRDEVGEHAADNVRSDIGALMAGYYARCATINAQQNDRRAAWFARARMSLVLSLVFLFVCAIPCYRLESAMRTQSDYGSTILMGGESRNVHGERELRSAASGAAARTAGDTASNAAGDRYGARSGAAKTDTTGHKAAEAGAVRRDAGRGLR